MGMRKIYVFLACPSDLLAEREIYYELLPTLGESFDVNFIPTGYELILSEVGERPQNEINRLVDDCDIFVLALHRRWGQGAPDSVASSSYTEEEFSRALRRFGASGRPAILCFFKNVEIHSLADPGEQLKKVLEFRRRLEMSGQVLYRISDI
jgi:hypothetical protein